jgi:hypothetical protein
MNKKTMVERKVEKLNQLYQFYKKISKIKERKKPYQSDKTNEQ